MVNALPVIVGFGGYNAAGRSSSHQAFRRMVLESLSVAEQQQTVVSLACLMARVTKEGQGYRDASGQLLTAAEVDSRYRADIINGTLIRRIESFDPASVPGNKKISLTQAQGSDITFTMAKRDLPKTIPSDWQVRDLDDGTTEITAPSTSSLLVESYYELVAKSAGELPTGFNPSDHYNSRFHPRGLQMALLGASDAIYSLGIPWDKIAN